MERGKSYGRQHLVPVAVIASAGIIQFPKFFIPIPKTKIEQIPLLMPSYYLHSYDVIDGDLVECADGGWECGDQADQLR
jgi:hypothetical protein